MISVSHIVTEVTVSATPGATCLVASRSSGCTCLCLSEFSITLLCAAVLRDPIPYPLTCLSSYAETPYKEIGVEYLTLEFAWTPYPGHHRELGINGITMRRVDNFWVREVGVKTAQSQLTNLTNMTPWVLLAGVKCRV